MAKKTRMGRNLNALLGGATRNRTTDDDSGASAVPKTTAKPEVASKPDSAATSQTVSSSESASSLESVSRPQAVASLEKPLDNSPIDSSAPKSTNPVLVEHSAAMDEAASTSQTTVTVQADSHPTDRLRMLGVDQITRGMYQPRRHFDQELLQELADSITAQGLIQPILVRAYGGKFELIAGERRWRASQLAGITDIPAIVRDMDDQSVAAVSLIENIQRADLNPLEEAQALERLCGEFSMTHQQVAEAVGRSRVSVTNLMRLLELHDDVKTMVDRGELDMGHARALLGAPRTDQPGIAKRITQQGLTVRAVEKLVKDLREGKAAPDREAAKSDPNIDALGQKLSKLLGAPVNIRHQASGSGKLEISYTSIDELEGILTHIK